MKRIYFLTVLLCISISVIGQSLTPFNNPSDVDLLKSGTSELKWFMIQDGTEIPIGKFKTTIEKKEELTYIITRVKMNQLSSSMIDSTVIKTSTFHPVYHSSYNQQRDMVLKFDKNVTGYYLDKKTGAKSEISEEIKESFFDSNFYPQLIRFLPLKKGYKKEISIFDYNPRAKIGLMKATIKDVKESTVDFNGQKKNVWKVITTDDISNNSSTVTYYIEKSTRELLKQEIEMGDRKMVMRLVY